MNIKPSLGSENNPVIEKYRKENSIGLYFEVITLIAGAHRGVLIHDITSVHILIHPIINSL